MSKLVGLISEYISGVGASELAEEDFRLDSITVILDELVFCAFPVEHEGGVGDGEEERFEGAGVEPDTFSEDLF